MFFFNFLYTIFYKNKTKMDMNAITNVIRLSKYNFVKSNKSCLKKKVSYNCIIGGYNNYYYYYYYYNYNNNNNNNIVFIFFSHAE